MQFRVDAGELRQALAVLKTVTRSPRITSSDLLNTMHIQAQKTMLELTATNLTTRITMHVHKDYSDVIAAGCVDLQQLARFARVSGALPITAVKTGETRLMLTSGVQGEAGGNRAYLPIYSSLAFPRQREYPLELWAVAVVTGELLRALEEVTIDGTNRNPSSTNEVMLTPFLGLSGFQVSYAGSHCLVKGFVPTTSSVRLASAMVLDGRSMQPLILYLRTVRSHTLDIFRSEHALSFHPNQSNSDGKVICLSRQQPHTAIAARETPRGVALFSVDPLLLAPAVMFANNGDLTNPVWLHGTLGHRDPQYINVSSSVEPFSGTNVDVEDVRCAARVAVPAFTLLDLCRVAREERLYCRADPWKGPLYWRIGGRDDATEYTITSTEWGNA